MNFELYIAAEEARIEREIREAFATTNYRWCVVQEYPMTSQQAVILADWKADRPFRALRHDLFAEALDASDSEIVWLRMALGEGFAIWQRGEF